MTLKVDDYQGTSSAIPTITGEDLVCKAWVNFNGTGTVAIRDQENVSSITDNGTGNYSINFATAMSDANYCINITYSNEVNVAHGVGFLDHAGVNNTTTKFNIRYYNPAQSANVVDKSLACFIVFGAQ
jgi:hypothetical protein